MGTRTKLKGMAGESDRMDSAERFSDAHRDLLFELSLLISERRGVEEIYAAFARHIRAGITFDFTSLFVVTANPEYLRSVGHHPYSHEPTAAGTMHPTADLFPDQLKDFSEGSEFIPRFVDVGSAQEMAKNGLERGWIIGLEADGEFYGMLTVAKETKGHFPDDHIRFLKTAARLLAKAVRQDLELERARLDAARARAARELIFALQANESLEAIFERIPVLLGAVLEADYMGLLVPKGEVFTVAAEVPTGIYGGIDSGASGSRTFWELARNGDFVQFLASGEHAEPLLAAGLERTCLAFLYENDEPAGALILARKGMQRFDPEEEAFISLLASALSQALANLRTTEAKAAEAQRSQVLSELAILLQGGDEIATHFERLSSLLLQGVGFDFILVSTHDPVTGAFTRNLSHELLEDGAPVPFESRLMERMAATGTVSAEYSTAGNRNRVARAMQAAGFQRGATALIIGTDGHEGLLTIGRRDDVPFTAAETGFIELVATLLGQAATNTSKARAREAAAFRDRVLRELGLLLNNGQPLDAHFQRLRELLRGGVGFDFFAISVRVSGSNTLRPMNSEPLPGEAEDTAPVDAAAIDTVLATGGFSVQYGEEGVSSGARGGMFRLGMTRAATFVLTTGGEPEGLLTVARRGDTPFTAEEMHFFEVVAALLAHAAANERRLAETIAEAEDQAIIAHVASAVARESNVAGIIQSLRATFRFVPAPFMNFGFLEGDHLVFPGDSRAPVRLPVGADFQSALDLGQKTVSRTAERPGTPQAQLEVERIGMRSHILTRALSAGTPVGVLVVGSRDPSFKPSAREERLCMLIADILGPAMANARAAEYQAREAIDQAILAEAASAVASQSDPWEVVQSLCEAVGRFIPEPSVRFAFREGDSLSFQLPAGGREEHPIGKYFSQALETGQAVVPSLAVREAAGEDVARVKVAGLQGHVLSRADTAGTVVGVLLLGSRDASFEPDAVALNLCRKIAGILGPAMANARAVQREREEAEDQAIVAEASAAAAREATPLAIVRSLRAAVGRFIPAPFVNFGFLEGDFVRFPRRIPGEELTPISFYFRRVLAEGQVIVPGTSARIAAGEPNLEDLKALGVEAHVLTRAKSAGESVGILIVGSRDLNFEPQQRQLRLCRLLADIVGPAMANAQATLRARIDAEEQRIVADAARGVAGARSEIELRTALSAQFEHIIPTSTVALFYREADDRFRGGSLVPEPRVGGEHARKVFENGQAVAELQDDDVLPGTRVLVQSLGVHRWISTSVISAGAPAGIMVVGTRQENYHFSARDLRLCRLIADFVGPAMTNLREIALRQAEAEEQNILAEAAAAVASASTQQELFGSLSNPIARFVPQSVTMLFYDEGDRVCLYGTERFLPLTEAMHRSVRGGQFTSSVADISDPPEAIHTELALEGIASFASTPITVAGHTLGALFVGTRAPAHQFSERDLRLFRLIGGFAGPAMVNLRESARRKEEAEDQRILAEAAAAIAAGASEAEILAGLYHPIRSFVPGARISFSYVDGDEVMLWDGSHRRPLHELTRTALREGQTLGHVETSPITELSREFIASAGVRGYVDTASTSRGEPIGLLFVGSPDEAHEFSDRDRRLLRLIANATGPAMANAREERRRREEAADERILSEIAAIAARASSSDEIIEAIPAALAPLVPEAFSLYGFVEDLGIRYQLTRAEDRRILGVDELVYPIDESGRGVIETGLGLGTLAGTPATESYAALGLQAYSVTTYYSSGTAAGVLLLSTKDPEFAFTERVLALLRRIVQVVGPAVETSRAEAELARQGELYGLMLRSLSEGVILMDVGGHIIFANALGSALASAIDPKNVAHSPTEVVPLLPASIREAFQGMFEDAKSARGRGPLDIDGKTRWFDYEFVPLSDPVMKALIVVADVTTDVERDAEATLHREQMEQASRLAALGELVSGVAHELNNPLTAILGFAEVMSLSAAAASLSEELAIIQKEALRARNIVRDLLFIVKPGTSERAIIPVVDLVAHIERLRRTPWKQQGIRWDINIEEPCAVWGNEHQLTQVILNLITNAEHALAGRESAHISISARCRRGRTEIAISDSGVGMDDATRQRVFEPFFTTKQGLGTGLGLPLSYSIVKAHEGEFRVESTPGAGTTFTVILPSTASAGAIPPAQPNPQSADTLRVLVVDDEPSLRKVCQRLIASMGYECSTAENSTEASVLATANAYDVVLCDYRLGSETADDVVAEFERVAPRLISRMVIATGATTDAGVVELTEKYGLRLMAKPYGAEELAGIIARVAAEEELLAS